MRASKCIKIVFGLMMAVAGWALFNLMQTFLIWFLGLFGIINQTFVNLGIVLIVIIFAIILGKNWEKVFG